MIALIIVLGLIFVFSAVFFYFFCVAFVRRNVGNVDNVDDPCNKVLGEFKETVREGIAQINATEHKWVEILSFDRLRLKGRYFDNKSEKTVILFHGYRSSALRDFSKALQMYTALGFNVLMVDQRAHGRSEGRIITFGVKESKDVLSWVDFVLKKYSPKKILLGGMSMGATTVLLSCDKELPEQVLGVIADCGFTSPEKIIKIVAKKQFKIDAKYVMPLLDFWCKVLGNFSFRKVSTTKSLKNSQIPILLIHGEADGFVPCEMSREAFKNCNKKCRLLTVPDADHGFSFLVNKGAVLKEIKEFLISCGC